MSDLAFDAAADAAVAGSVKTPKPFHRRKKVRKFSAGVMEKITASVIFAIGALVVTSLITAWVVQPTTPTIFVDSKTGCEYLTTGSGITPRLDRIGFQICSNK